MAPILTTKSKILSLDRLIERRREARAAGLKIVHCHGCFDLVHPGHVRHLEFAAQQGDILLVTVSDDPHVAAKGAGRPLIPAPLRAENLAALNCVDWVHIDPSPSALDLIRKIQPDIYLKGREYESNRDPRFLAEKEAVERAGGQVLFSSGDVVFSSTALIETFTNEVDPFGRSLDQLAASHDLSPSTLDSILSKFASLRLVVIGETIIDRYIHCDRPEIAAEGPIMTLRPVQSTYYDGGAAVIAQHASALGADVSLVTALPQRDQTARDLIDRMHDRNIVVRSIDSHQPIVEKHRFLVGHRKVMKIDHGRPLAIDERARDSFLSLACEAAGVLPNQSTHAHDEKASSPTIRGVAPADAVILADFGQGLLTPNTLDRLIDRLRPAVPFIAGDVSGRRSSLMRLRHLDLLCPNESELRDAMNDYNQGLSAVVWRWLESSHTRSALVTLGAEGVIAFSRLAGAPDSSEAWQRRLKSEHVPALGPVAVDELGCGDALLSAASLALATKSADLVQAAYLGSLAATIEARHLGNIPIGASLIRADIHRLAQRQLQLASATT